MGHNFYEYQTHYESGKRGIYMFYDILYCRGNVCIFMVQ